MGFVMRLNVIIIQMGQSGSNGAVTPAEWTIIRETLNGRLVRGSEGTTHFLKEHSYSNQEQYQQAYLTFTKKLPEKHSHILQLQKTNTQLQNTFCSSYYKISLLFEYIEHSLAEEIVQRAQQKKVFDQMEVWTLLCACSLALSQMIRVEGRAHAAIKPKDIRLNSDGIVKILAMQMVGMDPDHEIAAEGKTKDLAVTMMQCILMEEIQNDTSDYLVQLIETLSASGELKGILRQMVTDSVSFVDLEDYFMKLGQSESDSLNSYSHTPIVKDKMNKSTNSYSQIPEESKEDDSLLPAHPDQEDNPEQHNPEPETEEEQIPDQHDSPDESREQTQQSMRQSACHSKTLKSSKASAVLNHESSPPMKVLHPKEDPDTGNKSLFTDPKLLNLIHSDLEEIKKRKSVANSRKLGLSESSSQLQPRESRQLSNNGQQSTTSLGVLKENNTQSRYKNQESEKVKKVVTVTQSTFEKKSQINVQQKRVDKKYENIMENDEIGFKKNKKPARHVEETGKQDLRSTFNPTCQLQPAPQPMRGGSSVVSNYQDPKDSRTSQQTSKLEYVCETYIRGRYQGTKSKGMREGKGIFYYNEGGKYIGEWHQNKMHGKGVLYYPNNSIAYDGEWSEDRLAGKGILYNQEVSPLEQPFDYMDWEAVEDYWVKYEGSFYDDSKNGQGKLFLSNGEVFQGGFKDDTVWGEGTLIRKDGSRLRGLWREGKLIRLL